MLDDTRKKLREASFFFRLLANEEALIFRNEPEAREFYLSAFLAAARSVGDCIDAEGGDIYREWYSKYEQTLSEEDIQLLRLTNRQRNKSVHAGGPEINVQRTHVPMYELQRELAARGGSLMYSAGGVPGEPVPQPQIEKSVLEFAKRSGEPLVRVCEDYLVLLHRVIDAYSEHMAA